ncbi:MAG: S41 family peptidase, partial [Pseudomonadota bacterium]
MPAPRLLCALLATFICASAASDSNLTAEDKRDVIEAIKTLIATDYVLEDEVVQVHTALDGKRTAGEYRDAHTHEAFAEALTKDLVAITSDKHFKVGYRPELIKKRRERSERTATDTPDPPSGTDWNLWYAAQRNFGFEAIEILPGNVGYVKLTFFHPLDWMRPSIDAAMALVANTNALILDLSSNGGGYAPSDSYLGSFFFDREPVPWATDFDRPSQETTTASTFRDLGAPRYHNRPVVILVGERTFSLGEQFAYSMKHFDKAHIVGGVTAGAANGISFRLVDDNFVIQIPAQRTVDARCAVR